MINKLKAFLDKQQIKYTTISHSPAFTALEIAASAHIPAKEIAKTVMITVDGKMAMAVLPGTYKVDLEHLRRDMDADSVELASEEEFGDLFPDCKLGAMPPFGNLYGMDVFMATRLAEDRYIAFNAGSHTELIQMAFRDYVRLVRPIELNFSHEAI
jgi:Ala-tRNA(Pro) deacylase